MKILVVLCSVFKPSSLLITSRQIRTPNSHGHCTKTNGCRTGDETDFSPIEFFARRFNPDGILGQKFDARDLVFRVDIDLEMPVADI